MVQDVYGRGARQPLQVQKGDVKKGEGFRYLQSRVQSNRVSEERRRSVLKPVEKGVEDGGESGDAVWAMF